MENLTLLEEPAMLERRNGAVQRPMVHERVDKTESERKLSPFSSFARGVLQLAHVVLVLGLVGLGGWFAWTHIIRPSLTGRETVITVVDPIVVLRSSESGVFRREGGLAHGSRVTQGQLLGTVLSPSLEKDERLLLEEQAVLSYKRLAMDRHTPDLDAYDKDLEVRLAAVAAKLASVRDQIAELEVRSPVDGMIQFGVGDFQDVEANRTAIAQVWPADSVTLIEIDAPLHVVTELIERGNIQCEVSTAEGAVIVDAAPMTETLQTYFQEELEGRRKSQWASLRCRPVGLPASANRPGLVGSLVVAQF